MHAQGKSLSQKYTKTLRKKRTLEELGYLVYETWACKFTHFEGVCSTEDMTATTPLNVRDTYYGGCTNATTLTKVFTNTEKGGYLGFCSLYPTILKYKKYPIGHPVRIVTNLRNLKRVPCEASPCPINVMHG